MDSHKCLAASKPRPVLEPVMMMVWPAKSTVGRTGVWKI